jgi:hypothetical protein
MFDSDIERTVIGTAIGLWFAHGWYLNQRLQKVHDKLDLVFENFNGLRDYLYEIDPQFDDERRAREAFESHAHIFAGKDELDIRSRKAELGQRTLSTGFLP